MKILHWYPNFLKGGAIANAVLGLSIHQDILGAEVTIASAQFRDPPLYYQLKRPVTIPLFQWDPRWVLNFKRQNLRVLAKQDIEALRAIRPDVVHIHGEFNLDNLCARKIFKCPLVLSPRGAFAPELLSKGWGRWGGRYFYIMLARQKLYKHVQAFHALSPLEKKQIEVLFPRCYVYCASQGPNIQLNEYLNPGAGREGASPLKLICVGRLDVFHKGLDLLLHSFANARKEVRERLHLRLIGPDCKGGLKQLRALAKALGVQDQIAFEGTLIGADLVEALQTSDIYIQLSRYDGFSTSVCEALLMNKPAILSKEIGCISYQEIDSFPHIKKVDLSEREVTKSIIDFVARLKELNELAKGSNLSLRNTYSWRIAAQTHLATYRKLQASPVRGL